MDAIQETAQEKKNRKQKDYYARNKAKWVAYLAKQKESGYFKEYYEKNSKEIIEKIKTKYREKRIVASSNQPLTGVPPVASVGLGTKTPTINVTSDQ
jgi:hypothetical protein